MEPKRARLISAERDSFSRLDHRGRWPRLTPAALGYRVRRRGQPSVSVGIFRVVLRDSPSQLTLRQSSQSRL